MKSVATKKNEKLEQIFMATTVPCPLALVKKGYLLNTKRGLAVLICLLSKDYCMKTTGYEAVLGIEVHVQLMTESKIFCACSNEPCTTPNTNICAICAGHPGTLPVLNQKVVEAAITVALATECTINRESEFARKHYFYPDLPKNFQITQDTKPIAENGIIRIRCDDGTQKSVRVRRIHIEEDAGKSIHSTDGSYSFVDLNRAGTPLLEIVSEPDLRSAAEARAYLKALHSLVTGLGICSGNMEQGAFRADTNVSVRPMGATYLGTRCELKNINSFKFIGDAVIYEINRQIELLEQGEQVIQQTRLWDTRQRITLPMRSKETAADYRYMPEPDLPLLRLDEQYITTIQEQLPELPEQRFIRLQKEFNLSPYEADVLLSDFALADYYERAAKHHYSPSLINWVLRDVQAYVKEHTIDIHALLLTPERLARLVHLVELGRINARTGQELCIEVARTGADPDVLIETGGLTQIESVSELETIVTQILGAYPQQVSQYRAGNTKLLGFFVGKTMEHAQGKANPKVVQEVLRRLL